MVLSSKSHYLFDYGFLKKGEPYDYLLADAEYLGVCKTKERFGMFVTEYSFVLEDVNTTRIVGELYNVADYTLRLLDILMDHPKFCKRVEIAVLSTDAVESLAYIYFFQPKSIRGVNVKEIINGDLSFPVYAS